MLCVIETHPIQYHAPVWRYLQQTLDLPVTAIYGSDFSVAGYHDSEFNLRFQWDTDLLSGYSQVFLSRVNEGGARRHDEVTTTGLVAALRQAQPRAVLSMGYSPQFHRIAARCARRSHCPVIFRGETTDHAQRRTVLKRWMRDAALRWFYRRCAALLYVGERSREHFSRLGFGGTARFFSPYCVDTSPFSTEECSREELRTPMRFELGISPEQLIIAFFGKLSLRKGPEMILEAIRLLPPALRARCVVLLVGDGEMRDSLLSQASAHPAVAVRHVGFKHQRDLSPYYHAADLFILPSRHSETWGLVVNEALHHGLPVVVSDAVGCAPDLVEPGCTGEVFGVDSISGLVDALLRAAHLVADARIRELCRAKMGRYTVTCAAQGIAEAYASVLERM